MAGHEVQPMVSVIIPAYNAQRTLGGTLTGALTQTYPALEVIVVNDGSTDATGAVAASYGSAVRVLERSNGGSSAARNSGAASARGDLLVFCDADDVLLPPAVSAMVAAWDQAGRGRRIVTCNAYPLTSEGINPKRSLALRSYPCLPRQRMEVLRQNFALAIALVPREVFQELGGFDESLSVVEDWDMWLRAIFAGVEFVFQRKPLALWRWQSGSMSTDWERMLVGEEEMFRRFASRAATQLTPEEKEYLDHRLKDGSPWRIRGRADEYLRRGEYAQARRDYQAVLPFFPHDWRLRARTWSMSYLPFLGHAWRYRLTQIEDAMGRTGALLGQSQGGGAPETGQHNQLP